MTEMQQFTIEQIKEKGGLNPNYLAVLWKEHKKRGGGCSSRNMFGTTSAAWRTMRHLEATGAIVKANTRWADTYVLNPQNNQQ